MYFDTTRYCKTFFNHSHSCRLYIFNLPNFQFVYYVSGTITLLPTIANSEGTCQMVQVKQTLITTLVWSSAIDLLSGTGKRWRVSCRSNNSTQITQYHEHRTRCYPTFVGYIPHLWIYILLVSDPRYNISRNLLFYRFWSGHNLGVSR